MDQKYCGSYRGSIGLTEQKPALEFQQALGTGDGQGSLKCCSPRSHKESDTAK